MKPANIIYFGSPDFSAEILSSLLSPSNLEGDPAIAGEGVRVVAVVTSPDVPIGRKQIITPSPVAVTAAKYDLPIFKPEKLDDAHLSHLKLLKPDIFLVVSYGKIIPSSYLTTPTIGTFNIHFSLLPKYRGALPISEAIKNGDTQTGVTLMVMDEALDHGPVISAQEVTIDINDNVADLTTKLTHAAIQLLKSQITNHKSQTSRPQDESLATYTPSLKTRTRQTAFIPWEEIKPCLDKSQISSKAKILSISEGTNHLAKPDLASQDKSQALHNLIRSNNPAPGAWTKIPVVRDQKSGVKEIELKIIKTKLNSESWSLLPELVQLPGKSPISWESFLKGHQII